MKPRYPYEATADAARIGGEQMPYLVKSPRAKAAIERLLMTMETALEQVLAAAVLEPVHGVPARHRQPERRDPRGPWVRDLPPRAPEPLMATVIRGAAVRGGRPGTASRQVASPGAKWPFQVREIVDARCLERYAMGSLTVADIHARIVTDVRYLNERRAADGLAPFATPSYDTVRRRVRAVQGVSSWFDGRGWKVA